MCEPSLLNDSDVPYNYSGHSVPYWPVTTAASLSIAGSLFIVATYLAFSDMRTTARRFLVFISLADFVNGAGSLLGATERLQDEECKLQSLMTTLSCLSFILWTTLLAIYLYASIVKGKVEFSAAEEAVLHLIGWGIPAAIVLTAFGVGALGDDKSTVTPGWCWIRRQPDVPSWLTCEHARLFWMLVTGKAWEVLSYVILPILYILIQRHVKREHAGYQNKMLVTSGSLRAAKNLKKKFVAIPAAYILLRFWGTLRFFFDVCHFNAYIEKDDRWEAVYKALFYLQAFGDNSQGFVNFLIFCCFTERLRMKVKRCCSQDSSYLWRPRSESDPETLRRSRQGSASDKWLESFPKRNQGERSPLLARSTMEESTHFTKTT